MLEKKPPTNHRINLYYTCTSKLVLIGKLKEQYMYYIFVCKVPII